MNSIKRFLNSVSSMAVLGFIMGSFCILFGNVTMPLISYVGWGMQAAVLFVIIRNFVKLTRREKSILKNGVKHSRKEEEYFQKLGELRTCVKAEKVKILLVTFFHVLVLVYAVGIWALIAAKKSGVFDTTAIILVIPALLLGLLPLRHMGDSIEYYSNGFVYCGYVYLYQKVGGISFKGINGARTLTGLRMFVNGDTLDGSYLKDAKRKYYETYFKRAIDPLQGE